MVLTAGSTSGIDRQGAHGTQAGARRGRLLSPGPCAFHRPPLGRCQVEGSAPLIDENHWFWVKLSDLPLIRLTLLLNRLTVPCRVIERLRLILLRFRVRSMADGLIPEG
jgi:hypothetical protein